MWGVRRCFGLDFLRVVPRPWPAVSLAGSSHVVNVDRYSSILDELNRIDNTFSTIGVDIKIGCN